MLVYASRKIKNETKEMKGKAISATGRLLFFLFLPASVEWVLEDLGALEV